jgi:hypothetical protein
MKYVMTITKSLYIASIHSKTTMPNAKQMVKWWTKLSQYNNIIITDRWVDVSNYKQTITVTNMNN